MTISEEIVIAIIAAALPGLIALWQNRAKTKADATNTDADAAGKFAELAQERADKVDQLWTRVGALERQVARYQRILDAWRAGIARLIKQICEAGMTPVWQPDDEPEMPDEEIPTRPRKVEP